MSTTAQQLWDFKNTDLVSALDELPFWSAPFGQALLETVELRRGLQVLDLGSGLGFPALELAERLGSSTHVTALDPWEAASRRLQFKMRQHHIANLSVIHGIAERMPFASSRFDLITSNNGLNNVQDWRQSWRECSRVAKPGAQMVVTENLPGTMLEFYQCLEETLRALGLQSHLPAIADHIYSKRKPVEETRQVLSQCGFELLAEKHHSFTLRFLDGTAMLNHFLIRLAFLPSWKSIVPVPLQDQVFQNVEQRLNQLAASQGSLTLTIPFVCFDCRKREY